jgi:hypothetical protein
VNKCSSEKSLFPQKLSDTLVKFVSFSTKIRDNCKSDDSLYYKYLSFAAEKCFRNFNEDVIIRDYDLPKHKTPLNYGEKIEDLREYVDKVSKFYDSIQSPSAPMQEGFVNVIKILFDIQLGICKVIKGIQSFRNFPTSLVMDTVFRLKAAISEGSVDYELITLILNLPSTLHPAVFPAFKQSAFRQSLVFGLIIAQFNEEQGANDSKLVNDKLTTSKISSSELPQLLEKFEMYTDGLLLTSPAEERIYDYLTNKAFELFSGYSEQSVFTLFNPLEIQDTQSKNEAYKNMISSIGSLGNLLDNIDPRDIENSQFQTILYILFEISSGICKALKTFPIFDKVYSTNPKLFDHVFSLQEKIPQGNISEYYDNSILEKESDYKRESLPFSLLQAYRQCFYIGNIISKAKLEQLETIQKFVIEELDENPLTINKFKRMLNSLVHHSGSEKDEPGITDSVIEEVINEEVVTFNDETANKEVPHEEIFSEEPTAEIRDVSDCSHDLNQTMTETEECEKTSPVNVQEFTEETYSIPVDETVLFYLDTSNLESIKNSYNAILSIQQNMQYIPYIMIHIFHSTAMSIVQASYHAWQSAENTARFYEQSDSYS